ncbi:MAG: RluA family pseudouridine synthase [Deltaproteobacteria bacterium]|nr:RluA family pseudouridine synthase [Deltaproteobacteria bacterium]MBI2229837.1 RluA family pseudouridine synthase [Deltaproteobacteria bacterium]MBI2365132.1 RluA family pseudouridine synthase [Deltaproteobacteria bacterium]MBI2534896.1 RluA family pseudouridine synthase [Deltaproteobacteria bacterium]MBI3066238.1 RluA family pseudouridine synthase [Deltaproteobacteria bacterium]
MGDQVERVRVESWAVPSDADAVRLDAFVRRCLPHLSRRELTASIDNRLFWIAGRPGRKGDKLRAGQIVTFHGPEEWLLTRPSPAKQLNVPIIYEDASLMVVDKPAGMATHGFSGQDTQTLANFLVVHHPDLSTVGKSRWEPGLVHRLDRETSGLVLVAKTPAAFDSLRLQFRRREVKKTYWALVWGTTAAEGAIDFPIAHDSRDRRRMRALKNSDRRREPVRHWRALTQFKKICGRGGLSLVEVEMATGVTHQIRVHLAAMGHPIVGDVLYGQAGLATFGLDRHFLHARALEFRHPKDGRRIKVEAELPKELQQVLSHLKMKF